MRLERFLNEAEEGELVLETIERDCRKFIKEVGFPLYRGMYSYDDVTYKTPRTDRESLSGNHAKHDLSNDIFKNLFGWGGRKESVLVSADPEYASKFGTVHMIFPIGDYKYIYSPDVKDFIYIGLDEDKNIIPYKDFNVTASYNLESAIVAELEDVITDYKKFLKTHYQDHGLRSDKNVTEIMLKCNRYVAIKCDFRSSKSTGSRRSNSTITKDELMELFK